jgi:hypothetical protein
MYRLNIGCNFLAKVLTFLFIVKGMPSIIFYVRYTKVWQKQVIIILGTPEIESALNGMVFSRNTMNQHDWSSNVTFQRKNYQAISQRKDEHISNIVLGKELITLS